MYFFNPFNLQSWSESDSIGSEIPVFLGGFLGIPIILLSQFILRRIFNLETFKVWQFLVWVFVEIILLTFLFLPLFGMLDIPGNTYFNEFSSVLKHTALILLIPYSMALLILQSMKSPEPVVQKIVEKVVEKEFIQTPTLNQISFHDENGKIILSIKWDHLLFLKSEDNYIKVHYLHNDQVEKKLIRTTLKNLSREINHPNLMRTHRSFMVNMENVVSLDRSKKGLRLNLKKMTDKQIPVSATYRSKVENRLNQSNNN